MQSEAIGCASVCNSAHILEAKSCNRTKTRMTICDRCDPLLEEEDEQWPVGSCQRRDDGAQEVSRCCGKPDRSPAYVFLCHDSTFSRRGCILSPCPADKADFEWCVPFRNRLVASDQLVLGSLRDQTAERLNSMWQVAECERVCSVALEMLVIDVSRSPRPAGRQRGCL